MAKDNFVLSLGEEYLKVIAGEFNDGKLKLNAAAYDSLHENLYEDETDSMIKKSADMVGKLLADAGIKERDTMIVIPDGQSYCRIIEMPMITERELLSAIRYQADQFIPIPIEKVNLDVTTIVEDKANKKMVILLVAAAKTVIDKVVAIVETGGLIPIQIESETSASLRLIGSLYAAKHLPKTTTCELFINFGGSSCSLYLFDGGTGLPLQTHNFAIGIDMMRKDIVANFRIEPEKIQEILTTVGFETSANYHLADILATPLSALRDEVSRFMMSASEKYQKPVGKSYLFGEGSKIHGFDKQLTLGLNAPVSYLAMDFIVKNTVTDFFKSDLDLFFSSLGGMVK